MMILDDNTHPMPFTVPEGYFEQLSHSIMERIPEETATQERKVVPLRKRWVAMAAAASVLVAAIGIGIYLDFDQHQKDLSQAPWTAMTVEEDHQGTLDEMADYIMCDENDLYAYISGE